MKRSNHTKVGILLAGLALSIFAIATLASTLNAGNAREYVLTVRDEELRFVVRPDLGYVVKARQDLAAIEALDGILQSVGAVNISPIKGLGRKGVFVVRSEQSADENKKTIESLMVRDEIKYVAPLFSSNGETVVIIPEIVVRVNADTEIDQVQTLCESVGCTIIKRMEFTEQEYLIEVLGMDVAAVLTAVEQLNEISFVEWAYPNTAFQPKLCGQVIPNDEYFSNQWHLNNTGQSGGVPGADIRAPEAWEITIGDPNIVIAVLDSGVDSNHPDLFNNLVPGYDFLENDAKPNPSFDHPGNAHGTQCAGLIAAQGSNSIGVTGVTWNCKIMPIRLYRTWSDGTWEIVTQADVATAFRWTARNVADILSNSWLWSTSETPIIHSGIIDVTKSGGMGRDGKGCIVLFAAGNSGGLLRNYPTKYSEVIAVGATDHKDVRCYYSDYGPDLDIVAPGAPGYTMDDWLNTEGRGWLWTTDISGAVGWNMDPFDPNILDYTELGGTSGACPVVAGVAALILSVNPNLTNLEVQRILYRSAHDLGEPGWDPYYGWGRVDARAAVEMALNPPPLLSHYVDDDAPGDPGPGNPDIGDPNEDGSAEHPFDSIQEAIDTASEMDCVVLLPGTYTGDGNRNLTFNGKAITIRSLDSDDSQVVAATVIDCQGSEDDQQRGFVFSKGESARSVVAGLTITNAYGYYGGGINCYGNSSPTISKCVFKNNAAVKGGGGLCKQSGKPTIANCLFIGNTAESGGALYNFTDAGVVNCTFVNNSATVGGAVFNRGGVFALTNCILWNNGPEPIHVDEGDVSAIYSNIQGGWEGEGNIDTDPLFADPDNDDYHLKSQIGRWDPLSATWAQDAITSPCIDAGDPTIFIGDETEPNGGQINMGAYGGTVEASMSP